MKTKRDAVDMLIQLAFVEGKITTHGLYEQAVAKRKAVTQSVDASKNAIVQRLEAALPSNRSKTVGPLTLGAFLRGQKTHRLLSPHELFSQLGISSNVYKLLEHDRISPLKISVDSWRKIRHFFQIRSRSLEKLICRTHQLVYFRASFKTTLARYDARKNRKMKAATLERAAEELFARAALHLPRKEQEKLDALLHALAADDAQ